MKLGKNEKKYITRYIRLNQPCLLSDLVREICYNDLVNVDIKDLFMYLYWAVDNNEIILEPDMFNNIKYFKGYTLRDLRKKHIDIVIYIPNYVSKLWKNWCIKKINED